MTKKLNIILIFLLLSACGFEVVKQSELKYYYISNVQAKETKGLATN